MIIYVLSFWCFRFNQVNYLFQEFCSESFKNMMIIMMKKNFVSKTFFSSKYFSILLYLLLHIPIVTIYLHHSSYFLSLSLCHLFHGNQNPENSENLLNQFLLCLVVRIIFHSVQLTNLQNYFYFYFLCNILV